MSQHHCIGNWRHERHRHLSPARVAVLFGLAAAASAQTRVGPDAALRALEAGNQRFVRGEQLAQPLGEGARRTLAGGQSPWAIVLTSSDSRIVPEHAFNVGLGELYVVRVAGNVADPAAVASLEYAAEHLGAPLCIVLGQQDGADLSSLPAGAEVSHGLSRIAGRMRTALNRAAAEGLAGTALVERAAEEHTYETAADCLRRSAVLRELARLGQFRMVPALYAAETGAVTWLPPRPLTEDRSADTRALPPRTAGLPPHVALSLLQAGHRRFLAGTNGHSDLGSERRQAVSKTARPFALVLTDADSRVSPEHLFDTGLGDLAVVRVAGCTLDDEVLGSLEHAVHEHGVGLVLVLSPDRCGMTELLLRHDRAPRLTPSMRTVADWLEPSMLAAKHADQRGQALVPAVVRHNVQRTVREMRARSGILRQLQDRGQLGVLGAVYRLVDGEIEWLADGGATAPAVATTEHAPDHPHADHAASKHGAHPTPAPSRSQQAHAGHIDRRERSAHAPHHSDSVHDTVEHSAGEHATDEHAAPAVEMRLARGSRTSARTHAAADDHAAHGDKHAPTRAHAGHGDAHPDAHADGHSDTHGEPHGADHSGAHGDSHGGEAHGHGRSAGGPAHDDPAHHENAHGDHAHGDAHAHADAHDHAHGDDTAHATPGRSATPAAARKTATPPPISTLAMLLTNFAVLLLGAAGAAIFLRAGQRRTARAMSDSPPAH